MVPAHSCDAASRPSQSILAVIGAAAHARTSAMHTPVAGTRAVGGASAAVGRGC